jgi:hypothetical protein
MIRFFITSSIGIQILPKHSIACNGFEGYTHFGSNSIAFQELAPSSFPHIWHPDPWEFSPATFTFCVDVHHKGAHSIGIPTSTTPIVVMLVIASYSISLRSQTLNMKIWIPSLEISCSVLNTSDNIIAIYDGDF